MAIQGEGTALNLNRPYIYPTWFPNGFIDQFIRKIAFEKLKEPTNTVIWNRASSVLPSTTPKGYTANLGTPNGTDTAQVSVELRRLADTVSADYFQEVAYGNTNDLLEMQIAARKAAIVRALGEQIITGDDNPSPPGTSNELKGLQAYIGSLPNLQVVDAQGDVGGTKYASREDIHRLIALVRSSDGSVGAGADCLVTNERVARLVMQQFEGAAGGGVEYVNDPDLGVPVPCVQGLPIYVGQVPKDGDDETWGNAIWALKLNGPTGVRVIHATGSPSEFGIEVARMPVQPGSTCLAALVGGYYNLMVPEERSIGVLTGTTSAAMEALGVEALP